MTNREWFLHLKGFATSNNKKVTWQLLNTVLPYIAVLLTSVYLSSTGTNFLFLLPLNILGAGLLVRIFIFFHDCTHNSFVGTRKGNDILGTILGVFVFTAYEPWKKEHSIHHGAVGNLEKRGVGDIWTLTTTEFETLKWHKKFLYRLFRHPAFLFTIAPVFLFVVLQRIPKKTANKAEVKSTILTNLILLAYSAGMIAVFGVTAFVINQLLIIGLAASAGVWLFYVQHQFEEVYWESSQEWDIVEAALKGSTFYKLPLIFEWTSGYIGYHHIHHLNASIPNYNLKECYNAFDSLKEIRTVTLRESFKLASLSFYDEKRKLMVTYNEYKANKKLDLAS